MPYDGSNADACSDIVNPTFQSVNINGSSLDFTFGTGDGMFVSFIGTYKPVSLEADDRSVLYLEADNKLYFPSEAMTIGALRSYFKLIGLTAGDITDSEGQSVKSFVLNFGEETGIEEISNSSNLSNSYFTLSGRKLDGEPTTPGFYILNGRKVLIK